MSCVVKLGFILHRIIMELYTSKTCTHFIILLILLFLECQFCRQVDTYAYRSTDPQEDAAISSVQGTQSYHRSGKQFLFPVVVWPYSLRMEFQSSSGKNQEPLLLPLEYHSSATFPMIPAVPKRDEKFSQDEEENASSHANDDVSVITSPIISCNTPDNEVGICQSFTKCFPMMEVQYGSVNYIDYMNVPLAEQLILSTNATVCSQSENVEESLKVCCPGSSFKASKTLNHGKVNNDEVEKQPVITQRPPIRNTLARRLIQEQKCGNSRVRNGIIKQSQGKITGGQEAIGPQEFPWMVAVFGKNKKIFCGASLISEQFLLSAAHCFSTVKQDNIGDLYVHLGDFNLKTTSDGPHEVRKIEKIIIHSGFRIANYHNDIALLKLNRPVNFTDRISPICLPEATMDSFERRNIIVTGWGRRYRYGSTSDVLRKVEMPVWNLQECKNLYSRFAPGRVLDSNLCAGDGRRNKDACLGDSGGPAVWFDGKKFVLVGITSWGKGCGSFPGLYTRTSKYIMWITKHLNKFA